MEDLREFGFLERLMCVTWD